MQRKTLALIGLGCLASLGLVGYAAPPRSSNLSSPSRQPLELPTAQPNPQQIALTVGYLDELKGDKTCDGTGGLMTYAETQNYKIYICADRKDSTQPRYYRSRDRQGKGGLNLEAKDYDPRLLRGFEFSHKGYVYTLPYPTAQAPNPRLTITFPSGKFTQEKVTRYLAKIRFNRSKPQL